jgi:hypothetical protein
MQAYIHTHAHTYIEHKHTRKCFKRTKRTRSRELTYIHTYTHACKHTCIHTYITYTYIHGIQTHANFPHVTGGTSSREWFADNWHESVTCSVHVSDLNVGACAYGHESVTSSVHVSDLNVSACADGHESVTSSVHVSDLNVGACACVIVVVA